MSREQDRTRKNIKAALPVKSDIEAIRENLGLKTESHVLAYLVAMFQDQKSRNITLTDHQKYMDYAEECHKKTE